MPPDDNAFSDFLDDPAFDVPEHETTHALLTDPPYELNPEHRFTSVSITGFQRADLSVIGANTNPYENYASGLRSRPLRQQGPPAKTREELRQQVAALRARCEDGYLVTAADWHVLCDALNEVLTVPEPGADPWEIDACDFAHIHEREAIKREPPSVYYLLRHPKL